MPFVITATSYHNHPLLLTTPHYHIYAAPDALQGLIRRGNSLWASALSSAHSSDRTLESFGRTPYGSTLYKYWNDDGDDTVEEEEDGDYGKKEADDGDVDDDASPTLDGQSKEEWFHRLKEELEFHDKWYPLIEYLGTFGLKEDDFIYIYDRHIGSLQISVESARKRVEFLLDVGVKKKDVARIVKRQPQILEYSVESNLKAHVDFLKSIGISDSRIGHVITSAPSLFSYSIELSLKPTIRYIVEEIGIKPSDVGKVIQLCPATLVLRIESKWNARFFFLSREIGASKDDVARMFRRHPQFLHYTIDEGMRPKIQFLRSIGLSNSNILQVLISYPQVLSLSVERNLKPKYAYLVNELRNEVRSLVTHPMYLSISLDQRIRPRHRFLESLNKKTGRPFPLGCLSSTDERFCQKHARTSLETYLTFKKKLLGMPSLPK